MKEIYNELIQKYRTNNPYALAEVMGITIIYSDLGNTYGLHTNILDEHFIHINTNLNEHQAYYTVAHELGHCILHNNSNINFLKKHTFLPIGKLEFEADLFASYFVVDDESLKEINNIYQSSQIYGLSPLIIEKRYNLLEG